MRFSRSGMVLWLVWVGSPWLAAQNLGLTPLPDLAENTYQGFSGGLYPGGENVRPPFHELAGLAQAASVEPLDANGQADPNGRIGLISIGMSNAELEWAEFKLIAEQDPDLNPALTIVEGAEWGRDSVDMADPNSTYWTQTIPARLAQEQIAREQVQVVWLKGVIKHPSDPFPDHALLLKDLLVQIVQHLKAVEFPNLKMIYLASRIFSGYATVPLNPEPYAYEQAFAVKWLVEAQISGDPELNYLPTQGPVVAPWLSWGAYLWADGLNTRADGLIWAPSDFWNTDGTHPTTKGSQKVADQLLHLFKSDRTAIPWFLANQAPVHTHASEVWRYGVGTVGGSGEPILFSSGPPTLPSDPNYRLVALHLQPNVPTLLVMGWEPLEPGAVPFAGGSLLLVPRFTFLNRTDPTGRAVFAGAPLPDDPLLSGVLLLAQVLSVDSTRPEGLVISRALRLRLGD